MRIAAPVRSLAKPEPTETISMRLGVKRPGQPRVAAIKARAVTAGKTPRRVQAPRGLEGFYVEAPYSQKPPTPHVSAGSHSPLKPSQSTCELKFGPATQPLDVWQHPPGVGVAEQKPSLPHPAPAVMYVARGPAAIWQSVSVCRVERIPQAPDTPSDPLQHAVIVSFRSDMLADSSMSAWNTPSSPEVRQPPFDSAFVHDDEILPTHFEVSTGSPLLSDLAFAACRHDE